jgi:NadR type nicotinamide-nucleotide adenylyltransferase
MEKGVTNKIIRVVGPESTGKSTLCKYLAQQLNGIYIDEFARFYFETHDIENYSLKDVEFIYKKQLQIEQQIAKNNPNTLLLIDSSFITAKIWCHDKFKQTPSWVIDGIANEQADLFLLCEPDMPWIADSQRKNEHNRIELHQAFKQELVTHHKLFRTINGIHQQRLDLGKKYVSDFINSRA